MKSARQVKSNLRLTMNLKKLGDTIDFYEIIYIYIYIYIYINDRI